MNMKKICTIILTFALFALSGCSSDSVSYYDYYSHNAENNQNAANTEKNEHGNNNSNNNSNNNNNNNDYINHFESDSKPENSGSQLPDPAAYLNTTGELDSDTYTVNGEGEYYCMTYWLPSGEGGNDDVIAYSWAVKGDGYDWEFAQRDGYKEYLIDGNGIDAYLEIYSDAWRLYYPVGCELKANSGSSSSGGNSWKPGGFQNDSFGITVDPNVDSVPEGVCVYCEGSKLCRFCDGSHQVYVDIATGWVDCSMCIDGSCPHCGGTGLDIE